MTSVRVIYFKSSGKYYTEAVWGFDESLLHHQAVEAFQDLLRRGSAPGLGSGKWPNGYVVLEIGGVPHLIDVEAHV